MDQPKSFHEKAYVKQGDVANLLFPNVSLPFALFLKTLPASVLAGVLSGAAICTADLLTKPGLASSPSL